MSEEVSKEILEARKKFAEKFGGETQIGGKGTQRRKHPVKHRAGKVEVDKKIESVAKKAQARKLNEITEVNIFKDDNTVIQFKKPTIEYSFKEKVSFVSGIHETKNLKEVFTSLLKQLGPKQLAFVKETSEALKSKDKEKIDEAPELVEDFDAVAKGEGKEKDKKKKKKAKKEDKDKKGEDKKEETKAESDKPAESEELMQNIINKNINFSLLEKYNPQIVQIIDKMLKVKPTERYSVKQLLSSIQFKDNKIPKLIIQPSKEEDLGEISLKMVKEEKEKLGNEVKQDKDISSEDEDTVLDDAYNILKGIKIGGRYIFNKNNLINQEIYPQGSVLPTFKNKYMNKLNHVDQDLIIDLSLKLTMLVYFLLIFDILYLA